MILLVERIDPQFRKITDALFFTDRTDIDTSNYYQLLNQNGEHLAYFWDRIRRSLEIFWEESFWINRFDLILSFNNKKLNTELDSLIMNQFRNFVIHTYVPNRKLYNPYIHMIAWAQAKSNNKENVQYIKKSLMDLCHSMAIPELLKVVKDFTPFVIPSMESYIDSISKELGNSTKSIQVFNALEKEGLAIDKEPLFKAARNLLFKRVPNRPNRRSFFGMLNDPAIMASLKENYKPEHRDRLIEFIKNCDYKEIEEHHLRNIRNILDLDARVADQLIETYADRLYSRHTGHKGANAKRLVRACKTFPQFSPKKVLVYLSSKNKMSDIKFMLSAFPDLKNLAAFV